MPNCPCCSGQLLHHVRRSKTYWFCPECHQEMPSLEQIIQQKSRGKGPTNNQNKPVNYQKVPGLFHSL